MSIQSPFLLGSYSLKKSTRHYADELRALFDHGFDTAEEDYAAEIFGSGDFLAHQHLDDVRETLEASKINFLNSASFIVQWNVSLTGEPQATDRNLLESLNGVFCAVNVDLSLSETASSKEARLSWAAYNRKSVEEALRIDPRLIGKLLRKIERWAAGQQCQTLIADVPDSSLLFGHMPNGRGYRISQHSVTDRGNLTLRYSAPLPPAYIGDPDTWRDLASWYVRLSYFSRMPNAILRSEEELIDGCSYWNYEIPPSYRLDDQNLKRLQADIFLGVLVADAEFDVETCIELIDRRRDGRMSLCLVDSRNKVKIERLRAISEVKTRSDVVASLEEVFYYYQRDKFEFNERDQWERVFRTKSARIEERYGVIVEIDRQSYIDLVSRVLTDREVANRLIFFNDLCTEQLKIGTAVYFYVWDADLNTRSVDGVSQPQINGVISARGSLLSEPKRYHQDDISKAWPEIGKYTIWPESDDQHFPRQYFEEQFVALTIGSLEMFIPDTIIERETEFLERQKDSNDTYYFKEFDGIGHRELCAQLLSISHDQTDAIFRFFPNWEAGNSFIFDKRIEERLHKLLKDATKEQLRSVGELSNPNITGHENPEARRMRRFVNEYIRTHRLRQTDTPARYRIAFSFHQDEDDALIVDLYLKTLERAAEARNMTLEQVGVYKFDSSHVTRSPNWHLDVANAIWNSHVVIPFFSNSYFDKERIAIRNLELPLIVEGLSSKRFSVDPISLSNIRQPRMLFTWNDQETDLSLIDTDMKRSVARDIDKLPALSAYLRYKPYLEERFTAHAEEVLDKVNLDR